MLRTSSIARSGHHFRLIEWPAVFAVCFIPMPNDPQVNALKLPPHSIEAEQSVLGGLLLDNGAIDRIADVIGAGDFYNDAHRLMYEHIVNLGAHGKPADALTLAESLTSVLKLDYVGGL